MVFVADDLAAWLTSLLADAGRRRLTTLVLGSDQERALRQAATAAIQLTARDFRLESEEKCEELAMVINQVFDEPIPGTSLGGQVTLLEGIQIGIIGQLAPLGNADFTGTDQSSADILGISPALLAKKLTSNLIREIADRAARGGPLVPLAAQLNHDVTHLQGQRLEVIFNQLAEETRQALSYIDDPAVSSQSNFLNRRKAFEKEYRDAVVNLYSSLQLFGLGLPPEEQTYELSTAYISLSVQEIPNPYSTLKAGSRDNQRPEIPAGQSFEQLVSQHNRILLAGPAGAGKTTLLCRLAVHVCKGDLPDYLAAWQDLIPFPIRLRNLVSNDTINLPWPDDFVKVATPPLSGSEPGQWATTVLKEKRGLILIDGIDEVPDHLRPQVFDWIDQLSLIYRGCRFIITSRPAAVARTQVDALRHKGFAIVRLEPMTSSQVDHFIDLWHETAVSHSGADTLIMQRATALKRALFRRRDLATLASTPLLCAMLCALNRSLNAELPRGRVALYAAALTMLLERRDAEHRIVAGSLRLTQGQVQPFLSQMAMWMTLEGRRTIPRNIALEQIAELMPRLRWSSEMEVANSRDILQFLVERSGLLQDPTPDLLEFRHPSFQDYLSATEVFRKRHLGHILRNAHDPLYQDLLIMAVGQSQAEAERQRDILRGLLDRAAEDPARARQLYLLAAACIADVEFADPDLVSEIQNQTRGLLPPESADEADSLAKTGDFILDLLAETIVNFRELTVKQAAATVRVAALVNGVAGLSLLKHFCSHGSLEVRMALFEGWRISRVPEQYINEVLSRVDLSGISLNIRDIDDIPQVARLYGLRSLDVSRTELNDLSFLSELTNLEELYLLETAVSDLRPLTKLTKLRVLDLGGTNVEDVSPLSNMKDLENLNLARTQVTSVKPLGKLSNLKIMGRARAV